jgi:lipoate-protein ligase A
MPLNIFRLKNRNPYFNLAFEEFILTEFIKNTKDVYLIFYENKSSIILGKNLEIEKEIYLHKNYPPVLRRSSGGGSVVHFPGSFNFGLIVNVDEYPDFKMIHKSYDVILNCLSKSLSEKNGKIKVVPGGISDLCVSTSKGQKKISGNSQARKRSWLLHHGTILYNTENLSGISYYLKHPPKEPDYRKGKSHRDFMINYIPHSSPLLLMKKISHEFANYFQLPRKNLLVTNHLKNDVLKYFNQTAIRKIIVR